MTNFFDSGEDKVFPYSIILADLEKRHPVKYNSRENVAYLQGKIDALKDVENWRQVSMRDHTTYLGTRPLYGYVLMMQQFAEEMAGKLLAEADTNEERIET